MSLTPKKPLLLLQVVMAYSDLNHLFTVSMNWLSKVEEDSVVNLEESNIISSLMTLWIAGCFQKNVELRDGLEITPQGCVCCRCCNMTVEHLNVVQFDMLNELTSLSEYIYLRDVLKLEPKESLLIACLFLAWPFEIVDGVIAKKLADYCTFKILPLSDVARNEILQLKAQLSVIMAEFAKNPCCANC